MSESRRESARELGYLLLGVGPTGHVEQVVTGLRRRGWSVSVFRPEQPATFEERGAVGSVVSYVREQVAMWRAGRRLEALYVRAQPTALLSVLWARLRGIPAVMEVNGPYRDFVPAGRARILGPIITGMLRWALRASSAVVAVTPGLQRMVLERGDNRHVEVIPNSANAELFRPGVPANPALPPPYALWFGWMHEWQGIETMLAALASPSWPTGVRLVFVGFGPLEDRLRRAAEQDERILVLGRLPHDELPSVIAGALVSLAPVQAFQGREATGLSSIKVWEALACGVPVVVTDWPGCAEVVRAEGCGIVVPPEDAEAVAEAVALLHSDRALRDEHGRRGRAVVEREYSWERAAEKTERVLLDAARRTARRGQAHPA